MQKQSKTPLFAIYSGALGRESRHVTRGRVRGQLAIMRTFQTPKRACVRVRVREGVQLAIHPPHLAGRPRPNRGTVGAGFFIRGGFLGKGG